MNEITMGLIMWDVYKGLFSIGLAFTIGILFYFFGNKI